MKLAIRKPFLALALICISSSASATVITESWLATVTGVSNHNAFAIGNTFSWTVTYDDASQRMTQYTDGLNGIGEFGSGDDQLLYDTCTVSYTGPGPCTYTPADIFTHFSDAVFDLSGYFNVMELAGLTGANIHSNNGARAYTTKLGVRTRTMIADDRSFLIDHADTWTNLPNYPRYASTTTYVSELKEVRYGAALPEPATIMLLAMGIAGIGVSRRKNKSGQPGRVGTLYVPTRNMTMARN